LSLSKEAVVLVLDDDESVGVFVRAALPETNYRTIWCATEPLRVTRELGIQQGKGYLFAAPGPWETVRSFRTRP
jgi:hypothetical protein